jgi:Ca2+-binding EF-hand superfamily protein
LTRDEFIKALDMLKITDLSNNEIDILMGSIDVDKDNYVQYKEFVRKLSRHGVKNRTTEEQVIYLLMESLKKSGIRSLTEAF